MADSEAKRPGARRSGIMPFRLTAARQLMRISLLCLAAVVVPLIVLAYLLGLPLRRSNYLGLTWSMDEHALDDIRDLADQLAAGSVKDV